MLKETHQIVVFIKQKPVMFDENFLALLGEVRQHTVYEAEKMAEKMLSRISNV